LHKSSEAIITTTTTTTYYYYGACQCNYRDNVKVHHTLETVFVALYIHVQASKLYSILSNTLSYLAHFGPTVTTLHIKKLIVHG